MPSTVTIKTQGKGLYEITDRVRAAAAELHSGDGCCTIFVQHTSASLTIQENADPSARRDLEDWLERAVPEAGQPFTHTSEGPDDMPSHIRAMITDVSLTIPMDAGELLLGTWQGVFLCEHRRAPHTRRIIVSVTPGV
jgi:secondary thiamine-phosphate synthase enzyme